MAWSTRGSVTGLYSDASEGIRLSVVEDEARFEFVYGNTVKKIYNFSNTFSSKYRYRVRVYLQSTQQTYYTTPITPGGNSGITPIPFYEGYADVYLEEEIINTAPTTPGAFTQPTGELEIGDVKTIAWGASSDAEGNISSYPLEVSINGGAFSQIGTPTSNNMNYTIPTCSNIQFRVKARDSAGLESGYRTSPVFTVTKPKFYYSKYNASLIYSTSNIFRGNSPNGANDGTLQNALINALGGTVVDGGEIFYSTVTFNSSNGTFSYSGDAMAIGLNRLDWVYDNRPTMSFMNNGKHYYYIVDYNQFENKYSTSVYERTISSTYSRGSLVQSGIIAVDGTYPNDGRHTDGYWYVRGSRVNQSIAPPTGFTAPESGKVYKPSETASIVFGASTASNLSLYEVDYRYNNDAWQALAYNNTLNRQLTITNDKTKTNIQFRVRAKNTSGVYSDYVFSDICTIQHNTAPTITLNTENNLELSAAVGHNEIVVDGFTKDVDQDNALVVKLQINEGTIRNIASGISDENTAIFFNKILTYSDKRIFDGTTPISNELAEGVDHKLKVWTEDGITTSKVEERNFRVIHNRPPVISDTNRDLGTLIESPSVPYQVNDLEGNEITVTEKIDGQVIRTFKAEPNTEYTLEIPLDKWICLRLETHAATIEATDSAGLTSVRTYTFTRTENTIQLELKNSFETDVAATRILVTPELYVPIGATILIEACNNAFDEAPAWEDITSMAMANRGYNFLNTTKTAEQWGINIRFTLEKSTATQEVRFEGFGGAFD